MQDRPRTRAAFDRRVKEWHSSGSTAPIYEALGMTQYEYAKYVNDPDAFWNRETDLRNLEHLVGLNLSDREVEAFVDMLASLKDGRRESLTDSQREWVGNVLDKHGGEEPEYMNLFSSGKAPPGKPVPTPAVLQHRPLKPPPRKKIED
jgi:hypothetical protein